MHPTSDSVTTPSHPVIATLSDEGGQPKTRKVIMGPQKYGSVGKSQSAS
eukprot:COSAG01_NODE_3598_length_5891_cov_36.754662_3_plen_49_part_00